jgi:protein SCO1/2
MRIYAVAALIGLAGVGLLAGAAVIAHNSETAPAVLPSGDGGADRGGDVWGESYFPNVPLVTHEGEEVRFFDDLIEDKVVAINFIYTSCPDTCPVETARLLQVADLLGDRLGDDVFIYSMTIDPENDTQPVLQAFADNWGIPEGWKFLTGDAADLALLRTKLGIRIEDVKSLDLADHDVNLVIGNQKTGRWMKRSPFENPYVLADQLGSWLHNWKLASTAQRDYSEAPEIRQISDGEYIFRNRCSACHTIGQGEVREVAERRVGPDLYNVGQLRDREWLERWIAEPDAMLEEGDPLAVAMMAEYNDIPMPNMRLAEKDVAALLGYIDQESRRIGALRAGKLARSHADHGDHGEPGERPAAASDPGDPGEHAEHAGHAGHADPTGGT